MLEDLIYEILPVIGFGMCASAIFVLFVMRRAKGSMLFCSFFAVSDIFTSLGVLFNGFYGVIVTIYGNTGEVITPFNCLSRAINISVFIFSDYLHILLLSCFTLDRFIQILIPVSYGKLIHRMICWKLFFILLICSIFPSIPAYEYSLDNRENTTIRVISQCRFNEVVGEEFYLQHVLTVQWAPVICICFLTIILLIYVIRQSKHKWSYNWSEESGVTKQLFSTIFMRCFMSGLSVHVPLLLISRTTEGHELLLIKDYIVRISYWLFVIVIQPIWYIIFLSTFQSNVYTIFNKYSENTQRKWQSAADPPQPTAAHLDRHGEVNPFGSWYSMTGNIAGEAGIPVGNERSVSFYYDN